MPRLGGPGLLHFRAWLVAEFPGFVEALGVLWTSQTQHLTLAALTGATALPAEVRDAWTQLYGHWVEDVVLPGATRTLEHIYAERGGGILTLAGRRPRFGDFKAAVETVARQRAGVLVEGLRGAQFATVNRVLAAGLSEGLAPRSIAALLRPIVPLDDRSARAVLSRRAALQKAGASEAQVQARTERYAERLRDVRAERIARTELAESFHGADYQLVQQSVDEGLLRDVVRVWETAEDERTCPLCRPLDGLRIAGLAEGFASAGATRLHPPLHPGCRCTVLYEAAPVLPPRSARAL